MKEKESIKVSLGTAICVFIIFFLVIGMVAMYYFGFVKNNEKINNMEAQTVALQERVNSLQETKSTTELQNQKADDEIKGLIKNYILTDFGPQNNMKNVTVDSYKEITAEEYFSKTPGGPWTEQEKTEFLKKNPDLMYGYCTFTIELIDANKLTMEGSSATYQEIVGNNFKSEAIFTLNKTTKEINFATSYGFGNKIYLSKSEIQSILGPDKATFCIENIEKNGEDYIITAYMLEEEPRIVSEAEYQDLKNGKEIKFRNQKWVLKDGDNYFGILQSGNDSLSYSYQNKTIGNIAGVEAQLCDYSEQKITFKVSKNILIGAFWSKFKYDNNGKIKVYSLENDKEIINFESLSFERLQKLSEGCKGTYDECVAYVKDGVVDAIKIFEK